MNTADVIRLAGGPSKVARELGVHHSTVIGWRRAGRVPAGRAQNLAVLAGVPRHEIRPDLWEAPVDHRVALNMAPAASSHARSGGADAAHR